MIDASLIASWAPADAASRTRTPTLAWSDLPPELAASPASSSAGCRPTRTASASPPCAGTGAHAAAAVDQRQQPTTATSSSSRASPTARCTPSGLTDRGCMRAPLLQHHGNLFGNYCAHMRIIATFECIKENLLVTCSIVQKYIFHFWAAC